MKGIICCLVFLKNADYFKTIYITFIKLNFDVKCICEISEIVDIAFFI